MISNRKDEHIKYALEEIESSNDFDHVFINPVNIPSFDFDDVSLKSTFLSFESDYPFYINAMTGGSLKAELINEKLSLYAKTFNIPLVLGSQSAALKDESLVKTYEIARINNPLGLITANVSANASLEDAKKAIKMINANALSIHINLIQELVMSEGDRKFSHWLKNIKNINDNLDVPVIVKEVGFGMSKETITLLKSIGVKYIDVSGSGGTNFARIERKRNNETQDNIFEHIGISTVQSLINAKDIDVTIHASGGIRNALDIFKALSMGAKSVGLSQFFLKLTNLEDEVAFSAIAKLIEDLKKCFIIYGVKDIEELQNK